MRFPALAGAAVLIFGVSLVAGQRPAPFTLLLRHPAIDYWRVPPKDVVADLSRRTRTGEVTLRFEGRSGYLRSVLAALNVPVESQVLVLSKTSFQGALIGPDNPRALYFNDTVSVGWVRNGEVLEFAAQDPEQGTLFYTLAQKPDGPPQFTRNGACLSCHVTSATMEVPGMVAGSVYPAADGMTMYAPVFDTDHRSPLEDRWGGWYVTGRHGSARHMGNGVVTDLTDFTSLVTDRNQNLETLAGRVDLTGYLSTHSDIVALMVLEHQMHMANLFTRIAWETRIDTPEARSLLERRPPTALPSDEIFIAATRPKPGAVAGLRARPLNDAAVELVDYMLFVEEAKLTSPVRGTTSFAAVFQQQGPRDRQGRSLRDLDLDSRLLRYPCSYMIYAPAFDRMPAAAREAIYRRMWEVLSGDDQSAIYRETLSLADRQAIVEILRETKPGLPDYFTPVTR